jgi:glyoxylase-like metal-dependent hydrolase (beta-lactamase superfamily II)
MRILAALLTAVPTLLPFAAEAQDPKATLEAASKALGTADVKSIEMQGSGVTFQVGQSAVPGQPWPLFNVRTFTRVVNYDTASLSDDLMRTRALEPPRGGGVYVRGEHQLVSMLSGDHAWNVMGQAAVAAPIALADRQFQFWSTPHGVIKAAMANPAGVQGRTIAFGIPGRFQATAALDAANLVERVDGTLSNPVLGDMAVTVSYEDYRDFGGVKFPTKIRQMYGGFPALELTIAEVRANGPADIKVPDNVRLAGNPYTRVQSQKAADGVWYVSGGSHHSVVIEMKDHLIVAEGPLNDDRALAVIAEARKLVPGKPIKYLIVSHHHFDHSGGVRAFAGEGATIVTHDASRAFFEQIVAAPATVGPDHLARSGRKATVEGVLDRRELSDETRTIEVRHIAGIQHADDMLMVYLPKEKFLIQADAYTPPPPNVAPMSPPNPFTVSLLENVTKQGLAVDQILPLHGRMVPLSELQKAAGHSH